MINILDNTSQKHYLKKFNCGNYVANCQNYVKWKYLYNREFEEICQDGNASSKSLYIPGETNIIINGKSVLIGTGIKSIDPPCLGKASSFGPH